MGVQEGGHHQEPILRRQHAHHGEDIGFLMVTVHVRQTIALNLQTRRRFLIKKRAYVDYGRYDQTGAQSIAYAVCFEKETP